MRILAVCLLLWLSGPVFVSAQTTAFAPTNQLTFAPAYPEPNELVTVQLDDYAGGLFGAEISWWYDGEPIENSANQRSIDVVAGSLGTAKTVEARLRTQTGATETIRAILRPVYFDLIVEPQTYVPSWYHGRSLPSIGSLINVTARTETGDTFNPQNHVYHWQLNRTVLEGGPLRGQHQLSFEVPRGDNMILTVRVSQLDGTTVAAKAIRIPSVDPELLFFRQHPLYGASRIPVLTSTAIIENALTIQAEPFHLDSRIYNDPDIAEWEVDRIVTNNGTNNPYLITLQPTGDTGVSTLGFHVRSREQVLQGDESRISVRF